MLRNVQQKSIAAARKYFLKADYYIDGQELTGVWHGRAAAMLGLEGEITKKDWDALCQNLDPRTGATLTQRRKEPRRVGNDFNFRAPKGLSLLYGLTGDERLLEAFRSAVDETMRDMEAEVQTRVRTKGQNEDRTTGNLVWGEYVHFTSRPVDGIPDPHLHAHCFAFNATWDATEQRWKAAQLGNVMRDAPYFEAKFHSRLAEKLGDLGLAVKQSAHGWDLDGVSRETIEKFSQRMELVNKKAKEKGITDPELKKRLSASTRERKRKDLSLPELRKAWRERMTPEEGDQLRQLADAVGHGPVQRDARVADLAAEQAMLHVFERKAVVPQHVLAREALRRSLGQATVAETERALERPDVMRAEMNGRTFATTDSVLREEQRMIDFARDGRGTCPRLETREHVFRDARLNTEQVAAVLHVLQSRDQVMMVRGVAGTGKTTMMQEAVAAIEENGKKVYTFAPSANASRGVLREKGFEGAETVARLLADPKLQEQLKENVMWVDEAGLLGTRTMRRLFDLAEKQDCRVVLSGDRYQHGSVERGAALKLLETEAGIVPAELTEIRRQSGEYRRAVKDLSAGRTEDAFAKLDKLGWIKEKRAGARERAIAADYADALKANKTVLVISPTHAEGNRITAAIRERLKTDEDLRPSKRLGEKEREVTCLTNLSLTDAQRADPASYRGDEVLVFHQNARGHRKGERVETYGRKDLPLDQAARFTAYRRGRLALAKGDLIRITANGTTLDGKHHLNNGSTFKLKRFTRAGDLLLTNGWKIKRDFGHLAYGYFTTSHASQGSQADHVIIGQSATSFPASGMEQFYVSVSRGETKCTIYTDDKEALLKAASRSDDRTSAIDLAAERERRAREVARRVAMEEQSRVAEREAWERGREREAMGRAR